MTCPCAAAAAPFLGPFLIPCLHLSKYPRHSSSAFLVGRQGHFELPNLSLYEVQWKLLLSFKMQLGRKCRMLCSSHQEVGYRLHSLLCGKGFKPPLCTFQRVCNRGQGRLCFICQTCSTVWKSEIFNES